MEVHRADTTLSGCPAAGWQPGALPLHLLVALVIPHPGLHMLRRTDCPRRSVVY